MSVSDNSLFRPLPTSRGKDLYPHDDTSRNMTQKDSDRGTSSQGQEVYRWCVDRRRFEECSTTQKNISKEGLSKDC